MIDFVHEIKDAPIPTLLVVGGLLFLLLAVAGKISGRIEVPPAQQKWAGAIGVALLLGRVSLYLTPASQPQPPPAANQISASKTAAADSAPLPPQSPPAALATSLSTVAPPMSPPTVAPPPPPSAPPLSTPPPQSSLRSPEESLRTYWQAEHRAV